MLIAGYPLEMYVIISIFFLIEIYYFIYRGRLSNLLEKKLDIYKEEQVIFQDNLETGFDFKGSKIFSVLTNKKFYAYKLTLLFPLNFKIDFSEIREVKYKIFPLPVNWRREVVYKVGINNKKTFMYKEPLDLFIKELVKLNPSISVRCLDKKIPEKNLNKKSAKMFPGVLRLGFFLGLIFPPLWLLFGIFSLKRIKQNPEKYSGMIFSWIMIIIGTFLSVLWGLIIYQMIKRSTL